jgi:hypothetical protein
MVTPPIYPQVYPQQDQARLDGKSVGFTPSVYKSLTTTAQQISLIVWQTVNRIATALSICLLLALTGCTTAEQRAARDDQICQSYGAVPGSDAYVACRMQQQQLRQQRINWLGTTSHAPLGHRQVSIADPPP